MMHGQRNVKLRFTWRLRAKFHSRLKQTWFPLHRFSRNAQRHHTEIYGANFASQSKNMEITDRNSITLLSKVSLSVGIFSRNSSLLDNFC